MHAPIDKTKEEKSVGVRCLCHAMAPMILGVASGIIGCLTIEQMAPPIGPEFQAVAADQGVDQASLEEGRFVYLTDCARCHSVEPISRYSAQQWHELLPRMAREAKLDNRRTAAVTIYVVVAHEVLRQMAAEN